MFSLHHSNISAPRLILDLILTNLSILRFVTKLAEKMITENYSIDIDFIGNLLTMEPEIKDELSALKNINKSITALSDKFI